MSALTDCPGLSHALHPIAGFEQVAVLEGSVVSLTPPQEAVMAIVSVEDNDIFWRDDGNDPTILIGMLASEDSSFAVCGPSLGTIKFIRDGVSSAKISVSYFGNPK